MGVAARLAPTRERWMLRRCREFDLSIEAAERDQIRKALEAAGGKRMEAARLLGLSRRTLYRKLDKYGIA